MTVYITPPGFKNGDQVRWFHQCYLFVKDPLDPAQMAELKAFVFRLGLAGRNFATDGMPRYILGMQMQRYRFEANKKGAKWASFPEYRDAWNKWAAATSQPEMKPLQLTASEPIQRTLPPELIPVPPNGFERAAVEARVPPGHRLVDVDFSAIERRGQEAVDGPGRASSGG